MPEVSAEVSAKIDSLDKGPRPSALTEDPAMHPALTKIARHPRALSLIVAGMLVAVGIAQLRIGVECVPAPLVELAVFLFEWSPDAASRTVVAIELALAAAVAVAGTRWLAIASLVAMAFVSLACVSAGLRAGAWLTPTLVLGACVGALWFASRAVDTRAALRRGLSPAWTALLAIAAATIAARFSAGMAFQSPQQSEAEKKARVNAIDLDLKPYIGRAVADTPIATYLPRVAADLGQTTTFIVFYNPHCDACHNLFEAYFSQPRLERVIAVEIPPAADAILVDVDHHGPIQCPSCEFETLAPGPLWLVAPPMTVKVEAGVITCVADRFGGDCLNPQ